MLPQGRAQGRIYKRLKVLLRYTACTGLINQQYSHIAAFALAAVLGAEIVLPPAAKRDSFAHYFSVFKVPEKLPHACALKGQPTRLALRCSAAKLCEAEEGDTTSSARSRGRQPCT